MINEHHVDLALPRNLDQVDIVDVPELIAKPLDVATDTRACTRQLAGGGGC